MDDLSRAAHVAWGGYAMDLVVRNGVVVTSAGSFRADIGMEDGRVCQIGGSFREPRQTIDASGCYVMPGGVDVHTHLDAPVFDMVTADDFASGTVAAACGGTTTIVDFCQQQRGGTLADALARWDAKARGKTAIDYGYHMIVVDLAESVLAELATLPLRGVTSFKVFLAYRGGAMVDDLTLVRVLEQSKQSGALAMVHAENGDAVFHLQSKLLRSGMTSPRFHAASRPARIEAEATARAIALAEVVGAPIYIVHVSCKDALREVLRGKMRGAKVLAETCTHYLYLTADALDAPNFEGAKYVFSPPAREVSDQEALWRALAQGLLETVSSDHSSTNLNGQKDRGRDDFTAIPNGLPGIEERMAMLYQGVHQGHITLSQFVDLAATRPARTFGLYPRKGAIVVGADADLVLWDPLCEWTITRDKLHHAVDYSAYEGRRVRGAPRSVLLRGKMIVDRGCYVGTLGEGRFVERAKFPAPDCSPLC